MSGHHISDAYIPAAFNKSSDIESRESFKALGLTGTHGSVAVRGKGESVCAKCNKDIVGASLAAMGKHFHQNCFTCSQCLKPIPVKIGGVTPSFGTLGSNDDVWCENCMKIDREMGTAHSVFEKKGGSAAKKPVAASGGAAGAASGAPCTACGKPLSGKSTVLKDGTKYHPACFVCAGCKSDLSAGHKFQDGKPFCGACYNKKNFTSDPYRNKVPPAHLVDGPTVDDFSSLSASKAKPVAAGGSGAGKFCSSCGKPNTLGPAAKFCGECGAKF